MQVAVLDEDLIPRSGAKLLRLGRRHDGGYLVDARSVMAADVLLSFGINDDWSFEADFRKLNASPIYAFDASLQRKRLVKAVIEALPRIDNPRLLMEKVRNLVGYARFFGRDARHIEAMVGLDRKPGYLSLTSVVESFVPATASSVFLKIDIEGWEYRILDELVPLAERVCGLVIEFHNFDRHERDIADFVGALKLHVCHVHCNNFEPLNERGVPLAIEISRPRCGGEAETVRLPHPLDMPNDKRAEDYAIEFARPYASSKRTMSSSPR